MTTDLIDYELMLRWGVAPHDVDALPGHVRAWILSVTPRQDTENPTSSVTTSPPRVRSRAPRWWTRGRRQGDHMTTFVFGRALEHLQAGHCVTRDAWPPDTWLLLVPGSTITVQAGRPLGEGAPDLIGQQVQYRAHLDQYQDGVIGPWSPTVDDLYAGDWRLV